jgi:uncharacterized protein
MQIYLPIAEISVSILGLLALGGAVGVLSGMFGIGGGFLATPFLIFMGINPAVAVASSANQIVAASISGFHTHWKRKNVDFRMGILLLIGGLLGSILGVAIFSWLKRLGQVDLAISLLYVFLLGGIGLMMGIDSYRQMLYHWKGKPLPATASAPKRKRKSFINRLPWRMRFPRSKLFISAWLPLTLGFAVGTLVSIMGVGGGFFMIPAMIYLLGMPTSVVIGTSLFQVMFVTMSVTLMHAVTTHTVDIVLAVILLIGSTIGAQIGTRLSGRLPAEQLRGLLALIVIIVAGRLALELFTTPTNLYTISVE